MTNETDLWMEKAEKAWDKKRYRQAVRWYHKAAEQGDAGAQYCLGWCYYAAFGVSLDDAKAFYWMSKAAEQGEPDAQKALGDFYYRGIGVEADDGKALEWYRKAFHNGNAEAGRLEEQIIHTLELML